MFEVLYVTREKEKKIFFPKRDEGNLETKPGYLN